MSESIFDLTRRLMDERRQSAELLQSLVVSASNPPFRDLQEGEPGEAPFFGVPVRFNKYIPDSYGLGYTTCHHFFHEVEADGGEDAHMAKRHTIVFKFEG